MVLSEQFAIIIREAIVNLGLAGLACFCLVLLTVSNFIAAFYVLLMVVMVDVDILGLMWLSGLTIDSVTIINLVRVVRVRFGWGEVGVRVSVTIINLVRAALHPACNPACTQPNPNPSPNPSPSPNPNQVLAIGLVVDYSAHIAHSFVVAKGTRQARADHTR